MTDAAMVIVGAGQAGGRAALSLRENGYEGRLVLIGAEPLPPYERPPLSKEFLADEVEADSLAFAPAERLAELGVETHLGTPAEAIDRAGRAVVLAGGTRIPYAKLLLATGRAPRRLDLPGGAAGKVLYLRDLADARALKQALQRSRHITIIGGGFIGLEVAASATQLGGRATVVEILPRLLSRAVPPELVDVLENRHRDEGVEILCNARLAALSERDGKLALELAGGRVVETGAVLAGIGAVPRTALAEAAGLAVDRGIVVDATLATSDPDIFAAGDVTACPHPLGDGLCRLESWHNAEVQGALAARSMLGLPSAEPSVPWFWTNQFDLTLQIAGYPERATRIVRRDLGEAAKLLFHFDDGGRLVGVSGAGPSAIGRDVRLGQMLIERGLSPDPAVLADPAQKLRALLK